MITYKVLQCLCTHDLYLQPEKCKFTQDQVEYLGLIIHQGKISIDPVKVYTITKWPTPHHLCDLHRFLGFANFYHRFIQDFAKLAQPLNNFTKKDCPWNWGTIQHLAF